MGRRRSWVGKCVDGRRFCGSEGFRIRERDCSIAELVEGSEGDRSVMQGKQEQNPMRLVGTRTEERMEETKSNDYSREQFDRMDRCTAAERECSSLSLP